MLITTIEAFSNIELSTSLANSLNLTLKSRKKASIYVKASNYLISHFRNSSITKIILASSTPWKLNKVRLIYLSFPLLSAATIMNKDNFDLCGKIVGTNYASVAQSNRRAFEKKLHHLLEQVSETIVPCLEECYADLRKEPFNYTEISCISFIRFSDFCDIIPVFNSIQNFRKQGTIRQRSTFFK